MATIRTLARLDEWRKQLRRPDFFGGVSVRVEEFLFLNQEISEND
jgi:hypothetical protein